MTVIQNAIIIMNLMDKKIVGAVNSKKTLLGLNNSTQMCRKEEIANCVGLKSSCVIGSDFK